MKERVALLSQDAAADGNLRPLISIVSQGCVRPLRAALY